MASSASCSDLLLGGMTGVLGSVGGAWVLGDVGGNWEEGSTISERNNASHVLEVIVLSNVQLISPNETCLHSSY